MGVELAGAIAELARDTLRHDFRSIDTAESSIVLVEGQERALSAFEPARSAYAKRALARTTVAMRGRTKVVDITEDEVVVEGLQAKAVLRAAGVKARPSAGCWRMLRARRSMERDA